MFSLLISEDVGTFYSLGCRDQQKCQRQQKSCLKVVGFVGFTDNAFGDAILYVPWYKIQKWWLSIAVHELISPKVHQTFEQLLVTLN
jgi:hypothetical protein